MDGLTAARAQMELSLGFHMVFAALGIALPLMMVLAEALALRTGRTHYLALARKWSKATALLFAIGAVSGTALSFELGLLWPRFMALAGPTIGPAFALEGYAFFLEAIFVGLYLYGWEKLSPRAHLATGVAVAASGLASGVLVVAANAWMQNPAGPPGDPTAIFRNPSWFHMALHSSLACYAAVGFAVAGVYALGVLRGRRDAYHRSAIAIALAVGASAAVLQPLSGDLSARAVARDQPAKLAAMEALFHDARGAPLLLGGLPDARTATVRYGVEIPRALSLMIAHDPDAPVRGLASFPADARPNVLVTHLAFQAMVGSGFALMGLGAWYWLARFRARARARRGADRGVGAGANGWESAWLLRALVAASPLGFVALEAGWIVSEVGRQPWAVYGILRTRDAVTPRGDVAATFWVFAALYAGLAVALVVLLRRLATGAPSEAADEGGHDAHATAAGGAEVS